MWEEHEHWQRRKDISILVHKNHIEFFVNIFNQNFYPLTSTFSHPFSFFFKRDLLLLFQFLNGIDQHINCGYILCKIIDVK